jgi:hypothetical protein
MSAGANYFVEMREALTMFADVSAKFIGAHNNRPLAGSQAAIEKTTFADPENIESAWSIGSQLLVFNADHLSAFVKIVTEPVEVSACWTCVRSMLESCALAAWFLDPAINATDRASRVFAYRFESIEQQIKLMTAINRPVDEIQFLKDRIDAIENEALSLGYDRVLDKKTKTRRLGICQIMPGATDLIEEALEDPISYRLLSAVAHGHHWAIRQVRFNTTVQDEDHEGVSVKKLEQIKDPTGIVFLGHSAMRSFARPLWNQCRYFGWNAMEFEELIEKVADKMLIDDATRFWRS